MKYVLIFAILLFFSAGCRTYVGSDDIIETKPPKVVKSESGTESRRGVALDVAGGNYILTFAERTITRQRVKTEKYYCGRRYYYLDKKHLVLDTHKGLGFVLFPLFLPFQWLYDARPFACFNWYLRGDHAPGIGYCIAYLPIVHLLFTPILRPPYAYDKEARFRCLVEEDLSSPRLARATMQDRLIPVFTPDQTCGEIMISHGDQTISKNLSADGKAEFGIADFPNIRADGREIEFVIEHRKWGRRWTIHSPLIPEPETLRDWNIFADGKYDYFTRAQALGRMEPMLGEKRCIKYLHDLLYGTPNVRLIARAEIRVSGNPTVSGHENRAD